jgi:hypothetical protein
LTGLGAGIRRSVVQYPNSAFEEIPMVPIVTYLVFLSHTEAIDYPDL